MKKNREEKIKIIECHIKSYPDFPKKGILFRDICSVFQKPEVFECLKQVLVESAGEIKPPIDCIVALEARGFFLGPLISLELNIPFVPIRKKGKLPGKVISYSYTLEYGQDTLEIQEGSIPKHSRVLIVDDLLATGGTLKAACELIKNNNAEVAKCLVVIEIEHLEGRKNIPASVISLIKE